jgi:monoamine oxidase
VFGAEPRELSLLFVLFYIAASGNESNPGTFERNFNTKDGAQMYRFKRGAAKIAELMAKQLGSSSPPPSA